MFFMLQSCVVIDVPLHCVYDFHRYQGADVPDVIADGRLMHAGDVHSITAAYRRPGPNLVFRGAYSDNGINISTTQVTFKYV